MSEPAVTLTDFALALECWVFAALLMHHGRDILRTWWALFFGAVGFAAFIGGLVHGFFPNHQVLWIATMLTLGFAGVAAWFIGSHLLGVSWIRPVAIVLAVAYATVVLFVNRTFLMAIIMYLPATLFLLVAIGASWARVRSRELMLGVVGLVLTFIAAAVQQVKVAIHPLYFDHNALYHLIQFVALWLIFIAAKRPSIAPAS